MLQLLYEHAPVQNEYFQDYDIGVTWSRIVDMPVHTSFSGSIGGGKPLTARDGTVIGYYHVVHPQPEQLESGSCSVVSGCDCFLVDAVPGHLAMGVLAMVSFRAFLASTGGF